MGIMGALAGAGAAFNDLADRKLKSWDEQAVLEEKNKHELLREQRAHEARLSEQSQEAENYKTKARFNADLDREKMREDFNFKTDTNNIESAVKAKIIEQQRNDEYKDKRFPAESERAIQAKLLEQKMLDEYKDKRFPTEFERSLQETKAKHDINNPYEDLDYQIKLAQFNLEKAKLSRDIEKFSDIDKVMLDSFGKSIDNDRQLLETGQLTEAQVIDVNERIKANVARLNDVYSKYGYADKYSQAKAQNIDSMLNGDDEPKSDQGKNSGDSSLKNILSKANPALQATTDNIKNIIRKPIESLTPEEMKSVMYSTEVAGLSRDEAAKLYQLKSKLLGNKNYQEGDFRTEQQRAYEDRTWDVRR